jgi:hypothetical protein
VCVFVWGDRTGQQAELSVKEEVDTNSR